MSVDSARLRDVMLSEADVSSVLERAVRIEAGKNSLSVGELSDAAREAGIPEAAVVQAVWEILEERRLANQPAATASPPEHVPRRSAVWEWARTAGFGTAGAAAGMLGPGSDSGGLALFGIGLLIIATAFRAFHHRREDAQQEFQLELVSAWAGFIVGSAVMIGEIPEDFILGIGSIWFVSSVVGGGIVASKRIGERILAVFQPGRSESSASEEITETS